LTTWVLFDGFKLQALLSKAKSELYESAAVYRQTVLTAYQEVEDKLVAIHRLDQEIETQRQATRAAKRALYQIRQQVDGGIAIYLNVVPIENEALQSELALITLQTRRQMASVGLVKALGGGWRCHHNCTRSH
jgi:outer membrane protein TolC